MRIAKAVILAGSADHQRSWPAVATGPRQLFPVANRPILFHHLEHLRLDGLLEATILVDRDNADPIRRAVGDGSHWSLAVRYDEYPRSEGLTGALAACRSFIGDEPVLVQQADALLRGRLAAHLTAFSDDRLDALALSVGSAAATATTPPRALPSSYMLSRRALDVLLECGGSVANPLGEVRASGGRVRVQAVDGCLPCHGDLDGLLECNRRLLEDLEPDPPAATLEDSQLQGAVAIHPTAVVRRSTVRGPVVIGPGARLTDAYVGPYTSIGAGVEIQGAEIEHSIVLPGAELAFVGTRIESSVIGAGARVARVFTRPSSLRIALGDGAEILLS